MPVHRGSRPPQRSRARRFRRFFKRGLTSVPLRLFRFLGVLQGLVCFVAQLLRRQSRNPASKPMVPQSAVVDHPGLVAQRRVTKACHRPCLVDLAPVVEDWKTLSEQDVVLRVLQAMQTWIAQFDVMPALIRELEDTVFLSTGSRLAASQQPVDACLLRCCAVAILVCDDAVTAKDASHQLSIITRCMTQWMFPADIKTKRKTAWILIACCRLSDVFACCFTHVGKH